MLWPARWTSASFMTRSGSSSPSAITWLNCDATIHITICSPPKRGLSEDLVVAPYATQLALPIEPRMALANLRRLSSLGGEGRYGFYDAIDFTPSRLASDDNEVASSEYRVPSGTRPALLATRYS